MRIFLFCLLLTTGLYACKKSNNTNEYYGTVRDFTGLDGCKMVIVLDNGNKLEVKSIPAGTTLVKDKRIAITYKVFNGISICMVGDIADIITMRYL